MDTLCLGYGFVPSDELLRPGGLRVRPTTRISAARSCMRDELAAHQRARRPRGRRRHGRARRARRRPSEGRLAALGAAADLGALTEARRGPAGPAGAAPAGAPSARSAARSAPLYAVGPGLYELTDRADRGLPVRGGHQRPSWTSPSPPPATSTSIKSYTQGRAWGSARAATASRQVAALVAASTGTPIADVPLATAPACRRGRCRSRALADDSIRGSWAVHPCAARPAPVTRPSGRSCCPRSADLERAAARQYRRAR